ncbi:MAG: hypothetical protein CSA81_02550 [Acidobacteria bacterium]|nr:MAG: hypothetical protein CSA81_02550 [Acidobacteriota bacterium]
MPGRCARDSSGNAPGRPGRGDGAGKRRPGKAHCSGKPGSPGGEGAKKTKIINELKNAYAFE